MKNWNYEKIYKKAEDFAHKYSKDVIVQKDKQSVLYNNIEYPCVQLSLEKKDNKEIIDRLLESGYCTKMQGKIINNKQIYNLLLWFDKEGNLPLQIEKI